MPRKKRGPRKSNETPEQRQARIDRIKKHSFKKGEKANPRGVNGSYWLNKFKEFCVEETVAMATEDHRKDRRGRPITTVERARNIFQSAYKQAILGNREQLDRFFRVLGVDMGAQLAITGPDGEPLGAPAGPVMFIMGDAGTREDPLSQADDDIPTGDNAPDPGDPRAGGADGEGDPDDADPAAEAE